MAFVFFLLSLFRLKKNVFSLGVLLVLIGYLGTLNLITQRLGGRSLRPARWMLLAVVGGGFTGLAASGVTTILMLIKTAVHAHGEFTDYPAQVVLGVLRRAPLWGAAGLLAGAALGMASLTQRRANTKSGNANPKSK